MKIVGELLLKFIRIINNIDGNYQKDLIFD